MKTSYADIWTSVLCFIFAVGFVYAGIYFNESWLQILSGWGFRSALLKHAPTNWVTFGKGTKF